MTALEVPAFVLFDWNGTLIDDIERARQASSLVRERWTALPELTLDEFRRAWCLPLSDHVGRLGVPEARTQAAVRAWSTHLTEVEAPLSAGAATTLRALGRAGIETAVVSAASDLAVRRDLRAHGLDCHFADVHCGVANKEAVTERYVRQEAPRSVWYVGDSRFDMVQARGAGAVAVGYTGGYDSADELRFAGAHRLIDRLDELLALITARTGSADVATTGPHDTPQ